MNVRSYPCEATLTSLSEFRREFLHNNTNSCVFEISCELTVGPSVTGPLSASLAFSLILLPVSYFSHYWY